MTRHAVRIPSDVVAWWAEVLNDGSLFKGWDEHDLTVTAYALYKRFVTWGGSPRIETARLCMFVEQMCAPAYRTFDGPMRIELPTLGECRDAFNVWEQNTASRSNRCRGCGEATKWTGDAASITPGMARTIRLFVGRIVRGKQSPEALAEYLSRFGLTVDDIDPANVTANVVGEAPAIVVANVPGAKRRA